MENYRTILFDELNRRQKHNSAYSLRAFARDLGVPVSRLSEILKSKQGLSLAAAEKIATRLRYDREKTLWFMSLVEAQHSRSPERRQQAIDRATLYRSLRDRRVVAQESNILTHWHGFAIRRLTELADFTPTPEWIAARLGISQPEAAQTLQKLHADGWITYHPESKNFSIKDNLLVRPNKPIKDKELRNIYETVLNRALQSRFTISEDLRDNSIHFFAINKKQIARIKKLLRELEDEIDSETYKALSKDSVYCLTTHFFPLTT